MGCVVDGGMLEGAPKTVPSCGVPSAPPMRPPKTPGRSTLDALAGTRLCGMTENRQFVSVVSSTSQMRRIKDRLDELKSLIFAHAAVLAGPVSTLGMSRKLI